MALHVGKEFIITLGVYFLTLSQEKGAKNAP